MIEELIVFLLVLVLSLIARSLIRKDYLGLVYPIALRLMFIGVVVHEMSHYMMNLAVGIKPEGIKINWRDKQTRQRSPHGSVRSGPRSFLQAFLICLAPLYISTWLAFFCLGVTLSFTFHPIIRIIAGFICVSLILGAAPSNIDFNNIPAQFRENPRHSFYQIFLIILSGVILWAILLRIQIIFFLDVFYYIAIAGIYLAIKFSLIGSRKLLARIGARNYSKPSKVRMRPFTRKHYKPKKPPKRM